MATTKYGQTWWGQQWLKSLDHIDWDNRLPRGRTYANKGAVREVLIAGNNINAKVQGSRPSPYKIAITIPRFTTADNERLVERISQSPVMISKLLNRELDPQILALAERLGINVFPKQWSDFKMDCSCPDWAVPCKHLAAVIYKLCNEIDNNPFLVFNLHGLDLVKALKAKNISIGEQAQAKFPTVTDVLQVKNGKEGKEAAVSDGPAERSFPQLNYASIADVLEPLVRLLPDAPPFYQQGNFREVYEKCLKRVAAKTERIFNGRTEMGEERSYGYFKKKAPAKDFSLGFDDELMLVYDENFEDNIFCSGKEITAHQLTKALHEIAPSALSDFNAGITAFQQLQLLSLNLLVKGAVVPQLFISGQNDYRIRWLPAMLDKAVRGLLQQAQTHLPQNLVYYKSGKKHLPCGDAALQVCSFFLTHFISTGSEPDREDAVVSLFFEGEPQSFRGVGETSLSAGIAAWLSRLAITHQQYVPVLKIDEAGDENFSIAVDVEDRSRPQELPVSLQKILSQKSFEKQRYAILQNVALLNHFIPGLDAYLSSDARRPLEMDAPAFAQFLFNMLPAIRLLDIRTILPKALRHIFKPQLTLTLQKKSGGAEAFIRLDDLLAFDWQIAVGDAFLNEAEFLKLIGRSQGLVKFRGQYVFLDPKEVERLQKALQSPQKMSGLDLLRTALSEEYGGAPVQLTEELRELIKELTEQKETIVPQSLTATLRPYQAKGFSWLYRNTKIGFGSLIADDMGLGKTLQVIASLAKFKEEGWLYESPALVVAPTSLLTNWSRELDRFAPSLKYEIYHGGSRKLENKTFDVLLTSYGLVRSDNAVLKKQRWFAVIADEAQNIKNNEAAQTKALKSLPAKTFIAMSGTPVENRLSEYWSIMDFANRGLLGSASFFQSNFARPIQNQHDKSSLDRFKKVTAPFLLRRMKTDKSIIADLPDKLEIDQLCSLTKEQAALYETTLQKALKAINDVGGEKEDLFKRQGLVLQMILALKQICNHPAQFLKNKVKDATVSGKASLLLELLQTITGAGEKTLIFTQFTEMAEMLQNFIREGFGYTPLYLHGGQTRKQRDETVQRFQTLPHEHIFILSLKAGGTGLNLTAAQNVIHYDLWWNPAVEAQATDRAYRIGQKNRVMVHRFITQGTFEEKINDMIQSKKELAELSVGVGESWIGNLNNKELKDLFELRLK